MDLGGAQRRFARWVGLGTGTALVLLVGGFLAYVTGLLPAHLPPEQLARFWGLPLQEFLAATQAPTGWGWLPLAGRGDYFNYVGIALLASIVVAAFLGILPLLARHARVHALIALAEIVVLLAAASGLLNSFAGH